MVERPNINYGNLTDGRLQRGDYDRALTYLRHLNGLCQDTAGESQRKYQQEVFGFLSILPEDDRSELLAVILDLEIKVTGVTATFKRKEGEQK